MFLHTLRNISIKNRSCHHPNRHYFSCFRCTRTPFIYWYFISLHRLPLFLTLCLSTHIKSNFYAVNVICCNYSMLQCIMPPVTLSVPTMQALPGDILKPFKRYDTGIRDLCSSIFDICRIDRIMYP